MTRENRFTHSSRAKPDACVSAVAERFVAAAAAAAQSGGGQTRDDATGAAGTTSWHGASEPLDARPGALEMACDRLGLGLIL